MSKRRNKIVIYLIVGYLIATWGVNHILNPVVYFQNIFAREAYSANVVTDEGGVTIELPKSAEQYPYLSFTMSDSDDYTVNVQKREDVGENKGEKEEYTLDRGLNCMKIDSQGCTDIRISGEGYSKKHVVIEQICQTPYPKVNLWKTLDILISYVVLVVFWESTQYIKRRYAK